MSDYSRIVDYAAKDALATGSAAKKIKGTEIGAEYDAVATASATKANKVTGATANHIAILTASGDLADGGQGIPTGTLLTNSSTAALTNKTINLTSNTLTGTTAQFNAALSDGSFATLAGTETLTNKTLTAPAINGATINSGSTIDGIVATNLVDKSASETITGSWTFPATTSFSNGVTKTVMLSTPEAITMSTTGAWTTVSPTALSALSNLVAAIISIRIELYNMTTSSAPGYGATDIQLRATASTNTYSAAIAKAYVASGVGNATDSVVATVGVSGNGFDYYRTDTTDLDITVGTRTITAYLIGYIQGV